jgi:hypothetical protein
MGLAAGAHVSVWTVCFELKWGRGGWCSSVLGTDVESGRLISIPASVPVNADQQGLTVALFLAFNDSCQMNYCKMGTLL